MMKRSLAAFVTAVLLTASNAQVNNGRRLALDAADLTGTVDQTSSRVYWTSGALDTPLSVSVAGAGAGVYDAYNASGTMCFVAQPAQPSRSVLTGTAGGGMTANGGVAAAFDGTTSKGYATSAKSGSVAAGFVSANSVELSLSTAQAVTEVKAWAPTDDGFTGAETVMRWEVLASNIDNISTGVLIAWGDAPAGIAPTVDQVFYNTASFLHYWFVLNGNGVNSTYAAQVQFLAASTANRGVAYNATGARVNTAAIPSCASDGGPVSMAQYAGQFLGSFLVDDGGGTVSCRLSYGLDRYCGISNADNIRRVILMAGDPAGACSYTCSTGQFTYSPSTGWTGAPPYLFDYPNSNSMIRLRILSALPSRGYDVRAQVSRFGDTTSAPAAYGFGIGANGSKWPCGVWGQNNFDTQGIVVSGVTTSMDKAGMTTSGNCIIPPFWGVQTFNLIDGARGSLSAFYSLHDQLMSVEIDY